MNCQSRAAAGSDRQSRAPELANPPSKTRPSPPRRSRAWAANCPAGRFRPHEPVNRRSPRALSHPRRTPFRHLGDQRRRAARREDPALCRSEPGPGDPLDGGERVAECREIALHQGRQELHEHHVGDALDLPLWGRRKLRECGGLRLTAQTRVSAGNRDHTTPGRRDWQAHQHWRDVVRSRPSPTLHDEAPTGECPGTDRRAFAARDRARQPRRFLRQGEQFGQCIGLLPDRAGSRSRARCAPESPDACGGERHRTTRDGRGIVGQTPPPARRPRPRP